MNRQLVLERFESKSAGLSSAALGAAALLARRQQRTLRDRLDDISRRWAEPRLYIRWRYDQPRALSALVELRIACRDGVTCCALAATLRDGQLHARLLAPTPARLPFASTHLLPTDTAAAGGARVRTPPPQPRRDDDAETAFPLPSLKAIAVSTDGTEATHQPTP